MVEITLTNLHELSDLDGGRLPVCLAVLSLGTNGVGGPQHHEWQ